MVDFRLMRAAFTIAALMPALAFAHDASDRARGVIERLDSREITVETSDGHTVTFRVTPETRFTRAAAVVEQKDVEIGERVVVEGQRSGEQLEAVRVKLGPKPKG